MQSVVSVHLVAVLPLPSTILGLSAGAIFGIGIGALLVWVGAMIGAAVGFYLGR
jgi:uncharacterized membrane protein YdjX (TVP38/TMEM64 family)